MGMQEHDPRASVEYWLNKPTAVIPSFLQERISSTKAIIEFPIMVREPADILDAQQFHDKIPFVEREFKEDPPEQPFTVTREIPQFISDQITLHITAANSLQATLEVVNNAAQDNKKLKKDKCKLEQEQAQHRKKAHLLLSEWEY